MTRYLRHKYRQLCVWNAEIRHDSAFQTQRDAHEEAKRADDMAHHTHIQLYDAREAETNARFAVVQAGIARGFKRRCA